MFLTQLRRHLAQRVTQCLPTRYRTRRDKQFELELLRTQIEETQKELPYKTTLPEIYKVKGVGAYVEI